MWRKGSKAHTETVQVRLQRYDRLQLPISHISTSRDAVTLAIDRLFRAPTVVRIEDKICWLRSEINTHRIVSYRMILLMASLISNRAEDV